MGCMGSAALSAANPSRRVRPQIQYFDDDEPPPPPPKLELDMQLEEDVRNILQGLSQIKTPDKINPVVCLEANAIPLYLCAFTYQDDDETSIELPIISISRVENSRFVFFGSINFLTPAIINHTETSAFLENTISWGSDYKVSTVKILLVSFPQSMVSTINTAFTSFGYLVETAPEFPENTSADIIFVPSDIKLEGLEEKIERIIAKGQCIFCFSSSTSGKSGATMSFPINKIMRATGLAFATCSLTPVSQTVLTQSREHLKEETFIKISEKYLTFLQNYQDNGNSPIEDLDDLVSQLRYYVAELNFNQGTLAHQLASDSLVFLENTNYKTDEGICPEILHNIIAVILTELIPKIPPDLVTPIDYSEVFPGATPPDVKLLQVQSKKTIHMDTWSSTGLWLPAGVVGTVKCDANITIQIGSHSLCLLLKSPPWKRWPLVMTRFSIDSNESTEVASPFGGIVYILTETNRAVNIILGNFCRYPIYNKMNKADWEKTKDLDIPWCEIHSKYMIMTLPTSVIHTIEDKEEFCNDLDALITHVHDFIGQKITKSKRLIFDIDLPSDEPVIDECIVYNIDMLSGIINQKNPTPEYYKLVTYIALYMIKNTFYDHDLDLAISSVAALYALHSRWPDENIMCCCTGISTIVRQLWDIYNSNGIDPFAQSINSLMKNNEVENSHDAWMLFISSMGKIIGKPCHLISDGFGQSAQLAPVSSDRLHMYQLDSNEI